LRWCTIRFRDMSLLFLQTNIIGGQALFNHQKLNPNRWSISEPSEYTRCIGCQHRGCFWSSSLALTAWRVPEMMSLKKCRCTVIYTTNHEMVKDGERRWKTVKDGERRWKTELPNLLRKLFDAWHTRFPSFQMHPRQDSALSGTYTTYPIFHPGLQQPQPRQLPFAEQKLQDSTVAS
jgi:hypothetical protein